MIQWAVGRRLSGSMVGAASMAARTVFVPRAYALSLVPEYGRPARRDASKASASIRRMRSFPKQQLFAAIQLIDRGSLGIDHIRQKYLIDGDHLGLQDSHLLHHLVLQDAPGYPLGLVSGGFDLLCSHHLGHPVYIGRQPKAARPAWRGDGKRYGNGLARIYPSLSIFALHWLHRPSSAQWHPLGQALYCVQPHIRQTCSVQKRCIM